jgi:hypothetical protein
MVYFAVATRKSSTALTLSVHVVAEGTAHQPKSICTVPFRRDHDFVDRGELLVELQQKLAPETTWAALIGLGGIGYAICMIVEDVLRNIHS